MFWCFLTWWEFNHRLFAVCLPLKLQQHVKRSRRAWTGLRQTCEVTRKASQHAPKGWHGCRKPCPGCVLDRASSTFSLAPTKTLNDAGDVTADHRDVPATIVMKQCCVWFLLFRLSKLLLRTFELYPLHVRFIFDQVSMHVWFIFDWFPLEFRTIFDSCPTHFRLISDGISNNFRLMSDSLSTDFRGNFDQLSIYFTGTLLWRTTTTGLFLRWRAMLGPCSVKLCFKRGLFHLDALFRTTPDNLVELSSVCGLPFWKDGLM